MDLLCFLLQGGSESCVACSEVIGSVRNATRFFKLMGVIDAVTTDKVEIAGQTADRTILALIAFMFAGKS